MTTELSCTDRQKIMIEKILTDILEYYMTAAIEVVMQNIVIKERIATVRNMEIIIYSDEHNPPHFHVKSKDNSINAKFLINDCTFINGEISSTDFKRIKAFYVDAKAKATMELI